MCACSTVVHQQVGPQLSLSEDVNESRCGGEHVTDADVEAHHTQLLHEPHARVLSLISAETHRQTGLHQPDTHTLQITHYCPYCILSVYVGVVLYFYTLSLLIYLFV